MRKFVFFTLITITIFSANRIEQKTRKKISIPAAFSNATLTLLNRMGANVTSGAMPFYIPKSEAIDSFNNLIQSEKLFEKYQLIPRKRFDAPAIDESFLKAFNLPKEDTTEAEYWKTLFNKHLLKVGEKPVADAISITELPKILQHAKDLLIFFLAADNEIAVLRKQANFIKKSGLNRLFTYAKLARIIEEKKLLHIFLPQKYLLIFDKKANRYLSNKEAAEVINKNLKEYVNHADRIDIDFDNKEGQYEPIIMASKEQNALVRWNKPAHEELKILCRESPFDIGHNNIFSTPEGDAIIIDTEFKGETVRDCDEKL